MAPPQYPREANVMLSNGVDRLGRVGWRGVAVEGSAPSKAPPHRSRMGPWCLAEAPYSGPIS